MYILFLQLASAHHMLAEPGMSSSWKIVNTSYMMYLAVMASMIHGLTVPGAIEAAQRRNGYTRGMFEWLTKAPWGNPAFSGMFMSLVMFGFIGGITGVILGTEQLNVLMHNTIYVPGHFHGTVVAGTTLAFMAMTYLVVPLIFQRDIIWPRLAKWQPYLFGIGAGGISLFMMGAGTLGVPRRHWDISLTDAAHAFEFAPAAYLMMGLNGMSAILAATGGLLFVVLIVASMLAGPRLDMPGAKLAFPLHDGAAQAVSEYGSEPHFKLPGTVMLVTDLLLHLRALLLRELEVSLGPLAVQLRREGHSHACRPEHDRLDPQAADRFLHRAGRAGRGDDGGRRAWHGRGAGLRTRGSRRVRRGGRLQPVLRARQRPPDGAHPQPALRQRRSARPGRSGR